MNALLLPILASAIAPTSAVGIIVTVAIACVVIWAVVALIKSTGIAIPQPVWIVFVALCAIFGILLLARIFGLLVL